MINILFIQLKYGLNLVINEVFVKFNNIGYVIKSNLVL